MYVNVSLNIPADKLFTYRVPENILSDIKIGKRVFVPFGRRRRTGFIVGINDSCDLEAVKSIAEILDEDALFGQEDLQFYKWIAGYFMYPLGKILAELIPAGAEKKDILWITLLTTPADLHLPSAQEMLLTLLRRYPQGIALSNLIKISKMKNALPAIRKMQLAGLLEIKEKQHKQISVQRERIVILNETKIAAAKLTRRQEELIAFIQDRRIMGLNNLIKESGISSAVIKNLQNKGILDVSENEIFRTAAVKSFIDQNQAKIFLNNEQEKALQEISRHLEKSIFSPILLHGITGSGKTEVYLRAITRVLKNQGSAIYLVPEIALTPQLISRIQGRFNSEQIAILHSGIAETIRYDQWRLIKRGMIKLVVGARSALFAPLPDLRLIIVDEEHDTSYKQDDRLCYHARDLAVLKAKLARAVVVLGSATPGIRSYFNAQTKRYHYLEMTQRVKSKPLPVVEIIDMKAQKEAYGKTPILSDFLTAAIAETLAKKEQVLLFLNKRGFDTFLVCADCGYNFRCPNCAVSLKNHLAENTFKCHYCDYTQKALPVCPSCNGRSILNYGVGTQKLETEIKKLFPEARVQRMDSDTTAVKGSQETILQALGHKEIDVLVGTQMITKGHDFPLITLVGVIAADTSLNLPDFRAGEKTFQQLTQVAGRGGRGETPGRVLIQTFNPQHYALKYVKDHDYKSFYAEEIAFRQALNYPPFSRIINFRLSATKKDILLEYARHAAEAAKKLNIQYANIVEIIGPAESPLAKIKGRYRWQMLLKSTKSNILHKFAQELLSKIEKSTVKITVDVDPENFM
jgi:primosomal protein N' (replication factor Y) (superfamily II helicase)